MARLSDSRAAQAARELEESYSALCQPRHDYAPADLTRFRHLDLRWYDSTAAAVARFRFRAVGDIEDRTVNMVPRRTFLPTFVRVMLSEDGCITAGLYHNKLRLWLPALAVALRRGGRSMRVVDFETEYSDGSFVITNTTRDPLGEPPMPEGVLVERHDEHAGIDRLLERHHARMRAHEQSTGAKPLACTSLGEVLDAQQRANALTAQFRAQAGVTREEIAIILAGHRDAAEQVHAHLQARRAARS